MGAVQVGKVRKVRGTGREWEMEKEIGRRVLENREVGDGEKIINEISEW